MLRKVLSPLLAPEALSTLLRFYKVFPLCGFLDGDLRLQLLPKLFPHSNMNLYSFFPMWFI